MLHRYQLFQTNRPCEVIMHWWGNGYLNLNPPYQRGDVWGPVRRRNLIRSILIGVPIPAIIINDRTRHRNWGDPEQEFLAVIDGKQRMTSVAQFITDQLPVPGEWFGVAGEPVFSELPINRQRGFRNMALAFSEGSLSSIEEEQEVFELVNFGGVPQGQTDL